MVVTDTWPATSVPALLMFAKYSVGAQRAAPALARHLLCPKTTLYSAGINNDKPPHGSHDCASSNAPVVPNGMPTARHVFKRLRFHGGLRRRTHSLASWVGVSSTVEDRDRMTPSSLSTASQIKGLRKCRLSYCRHFRGKATALEKVATVVAVKISRCGFALGKSAGISGKLAADFVLVGKR